ncbi:MAG: TIR domain-containing protein, partial [Microbacteriaceae bacterium]|nr:TIR domain-containing protein [Burkholderiaceae bacterium]
YHHIRALRGRFTLGLLQDTVWRGKSATESRVLLDMMRSCEVCFEVRAADDGQGIEAEYIAPELLPEAAQLVDSLDAERAKMPADAPSAELRWRFNFLHSGHLRAALSRVGRCAGEQAWYWHEGFLGYEVRHQAWLELGVQRDATGHGGSLWFRAVGAQVAELLDKVRQTMPADWGDPEGADSFERGGDRALRRAAAAQAVYPEAGDAATRTAPRPQPLPLAFAASPRSDPRPRVAISYAWGDKTPAGQQREALVDRLCDQAQARYAIRLWRDADVMKQGERISRFMGELAAHDRIIVVLSDKYLKSAYCMFELSEIWRLARRDGDAFLARVTVWALPDARLHSIIERLAIAKHWRDHFKTLDQLVREDPALLAVSDMAQYKNIERYASEVGEMLALIADTLLPRNEDADFEPFLQRSLGG